MPERLQGLRHILQGNAGCTSDKAHPVFAVTRTYHDDTTQEPKKILSLMLRFS